MMPVWCSHGGEEVGNWGLFSEKWNQEKTLGHEVWSLTWIGNRNWDTGYPSVENGHIKAWKQKVCYSLFRRGACPGIPELEVGFQHRGAILVYPPWGDVQGPQGWCTCCPQLLVSPSLKVNFSVDGNAASLLLGRPTPENIWERCPPEVGRSGCIGVIPEDLGNLGKEITCWSSRRGSEALLFVHWMSVSLCPSGLRQSRYTHESISCSLFAQNASLTSFFYLVIFSFILSG